MPRRPSKRSRSGDSKPRTLNRSDGKVDKWNTVSDIPLDEEDQFHASRDNILLEGNSYGGSDDGDDDEIFALKGMVDSDEDDQGDYEGMDENDLHTGDLAGEPEKTKAKNFKKKGKAKDSSEQEESEEEEETWGRSKAAYYSSNAAELESDDEEGHELEEQEAKRLQAKACADLGEDDFGLDNIPDAEGHNFADDTIEPPATLISALPTDKIQLRRHLEKTTPETLALARDWEETARNLTKTREKLDKIQDEDPDALSLGMVHLHYQALLSYATVLAFYFYLRASEKYVQRPELLNSHPILQRLLTLKQSLATLEDLDFAASDSEYDEDSDEDSDEEGFDINWKSLMQDGKALWDADQKFVPGLDEDELADLLRDAEEERMESIARSKMEKPPKKKRKSTNSGSWISKTGITTCADEAQVVPVFDLQEPEFVPSKASSRTRADGAVDAYGEVTQLQEVDAADKSARKKSLRFHTSKIESASARRQGARNQAVGGDDDLPYRERKKDKEARLAKEAQNRVKGQGGADLDDAEPDTRSSEKRRRDDDSGDESVDNSDGYYELIKKKSKEKKEKKKTKYDAYQAAARPNVNDDDAFGPRSLTRAILANKGLTPHRSKSVRNPRVKKRQKFEKAKKKISSQKAVYKGGLADTGRYDGEKSGISKVVKSIRLG
ncbi:Sas10 C-terminal domain-containing protein [Crucibulum laeve]|uniref:Sas10 C-terminal domain-containing protein n=1 Tax=Crucibulum laeve TaxID=68775 RepID=A0A5C3MHH8_9AGAR|nr:Sas10 C-terminal domain-containing protein [Crucibulum laeve]